ncbi:MAG: class I SAM-dependent methyltransferase [Candidatus Poribacteria bacterium]|nr:class I SAM-dependent methyltransferase [Candidatus Poribacteria bacterium]
MNTVSNKFLRTDFGHEVYDEWYLGPASYNFDSPEFVERHFPFYEKALLLSKDDKILEAGCGTGSYSREFARRGYHIVGMDLSPNFLSEAKKITQRENLEIDFILGDYNEMSFEEKFSVIFFEGSFFYQSMEGLISLLNRIHKALRPNGRVYFVHSNHTTRKQQFPMANWSEIKKNVFVLESGEYDESENVERCTWLKIDLETQKHYRCDFSVMHLPPDELKNCLVEAGFTDFHFYKKRRPEDFNSENDNGFSVVAKK